MARKTKAPRADICAGRKPDFIHFLLNTCQSNRSICLVSSKQQLYIGVCVCVCVMSRWMLSALRDESSLRDAAHVTGRRKHDSWILFRLFVNQRPDLDLAEYQTGLRRPGLSIILPRQPGAASLMWQLNAAHSRAHSRHYLSSGGLVYTWIFIVIGSIKIAGE